MEFMIDVTLVAQKHIVEILSTQPKGTQIRVFVNNPGTVSAECGICYYSSVLSRSSDLELKFNFFSIFVDQFCVPFLKGAQIDLIVNALGSRLTLKAPNAKKMHGCMENIEDSNLSLEERVRNVLLFKINPQLAMHGGSVELIRITEDFLVILQFHGGCNGCAMSNYTIKEGIETALMKIFPELAGVCDVTEHQHGTHSYY